jgi:PKHD-type hydroxylase
MIFNLEPRHSPNKDTHAYWEDFLSLEEINLILASPVWHGLTKGQIGGVDGSGGVVNKNVRETEICWWVPEKENFHIWQKFSNVVSEVNRQYFNFDLTGFYEPAQLGLYTGNQQSHYEWHTDGSPKDLNVPRKLSMVLMLSDPSEFEGGQLQIKVSNDDPINLEQKKGRAWFFPSYVLHRVTPVTRGIRRSLVLWVGGPEFK